MTEQEAFEKYLYENFDIYSKYEKIECFQAGRVYEAERTKKLAKAAEAALLGGSFKHPSIVENLRKALREYQRGESNE